MPPDSIGTVLDLMESHHAMGWLKKGSKMMMASYVPSPAYTAYNFKVMDTSTTTQVGSLLPLLPLLRKTHIAPKKN